MCESESGLSRGMTEHKTQQAQDQNIAVRAELAMGTDPPSRIAIASSSNADPRVVAGELPTRNPP